MDRIEMTESEWLTELQRMPPDLARVVCKVGLTVNGVRRFPPRRFVVVPNSHPASPDHQ